MSQRIDAHQHFWRVERGDYFWLKPELAPLKRLTQHPNLRVVIDHCAKPRIAEGLFEPWAADMARLARETTAFCKVSGLVTEAKKDWDAQDLQPYLDHVAEHFGPKRLIWGSDWPVCTLAATYQKWVEAAEELAGGFSRGEREALFGGNAISLYRLEESGRLARKGGGRS